MGNESSKKKEKKNKSNDNTKSGNSKIDSYVSLANRESDETKALAYFQNAINVDPKNPYAYCEQGVWCYLKDQNEKAVELFSKAIDMKSSDEKTTGRAHRFRGMLFVLPFADYPKALEDLTLAAKYTPEDIHVFNNRARLYIRLNRYEEALGDLNESLKLKGNDENILKERGKILGYKLNRPEDALKDFNRQVEIKGRTCWPYLDRANLLRDLFSKDRYNDALADYNKSIELGGDQYKKTLIIHRGLLHMKYDNHELALADFDKAIELDPNMMNYFLRGIIFRKWGDDEKALSDFNKSIDTKSHRYFQHFERGDLLITKFDREGDALKDFQRSSGMLPAEKEYSSMDWVSGMMKRRYEKVLEELNSLMTDVQDFQLLLRRAFLLEVLGKYDDALKDWQVIMDLKSDFGFARRKAERLAKSIKNNL